MKTIRRNLSNLLISLCELLAGILLLLDPVEYTKIVIMAVGLALVIMGVILSLSHFRTPAEEAARNYRLTIGLLLLAGGIFCILGFQWFLTTFPVLPTLYGVVLVVDGIVKIQWTVDMARFRNPQWFLALIGALLCLAMAAFIFSDPFTDTDILWICTGIFLILCALLDLVTLVYKGRGQRAYELKAKAEAEDEVMETADLTAEETDEADVDWDDPD